MNILYQAINKMYVKQIFTNWLYKYIHKNVLFFKQIFTNYFNYENSIVTFHNQLPIEIWLIIMNYASHVSRIKITSTCKNFHKYNEMYTQVLFDSINPRIDIEPIIVTHLVTNIPFDKHDILKLHYWKHIPDTIQCIQLCTLKFIILPNDFYPVRYPLVAKNHYENKRKVDFRMLNNPKVPAPIKPNHLQCNLAL